MKRLIVVCEGPTEQEFCSSVLMQHFASGCLSVGHNARIAPSFRTTIC